MDKPNEGDRERKPYQKIDYWVLAEAYEEALERIELLEEYATRMLQLCAFHKYEP